jgi:hypothetical protein
MLTPALYTFYDDFMNQTDFFHDDRFNLPQEAAIKLKKTRDFYAYNFRNYGECFPEMIKTAEKIKTTEQLNNIRWFYSLEEKQKHFTLSVETLCPTRGKALFFKGSLDDFLARFSPSSKPLSAVYTFHDECLFEPLYLIAEKDNNPDGAAYRFKHMNKLYNVSTMTYPAAFVRANHDVAFTLKEHPADYLYTLLPSEDEDTWEDFVLKAYNHDTESRLFFEGSVGEFITLYGQ